MINSISGINNINKVQNIQNQSATATTVPVSNVQNAEPVYPSYAPIAPKGFQKLGSIKIPYTDNAQVYQLANGQKLVALKKKGPTTINTFVGVGSFNEPDDVRGISHYIEHNLFNGSSGLKPNEFVEKVSDMGGTYNASTGFMSTNYYIKSPLHNNNDLDEMLKIHSNMLEAPNFDVDMLEKEKGIVCSEIQMLEDRPYLKAENIMLKNLFGVETKSTDLIGGNVSNIQNLNKNKVTDFYNKYYSPDNMTTVIVGDINPDEVAQKLNKLFISRRPATPQKDYQPLKTIENTVRADIMSPNVKSSVVNMGFVGPKNNDVKSKVAFDALSLAMIGNKNAVLTKDLEKFDTDAYVGYETVSNKSDDPVAISLSASFKNGKQDDGLKQIYSTINEMQYKPMNQKDLDNIKRDMKNSYKSVSESSMALTSIIGSSQLDGSLEDLNKSFEAIDTLTTQDIMDAAKYLDLNKASIVVIHPEDKNEVSFSGSKKFHSDAVSKIDLGQTETYNLKNNMMVDYQQVESPFGYTSIAIHNEDIKDMKPGLSLVLTSMLNKGSAYNDKEAFYKKANETDVGVSLEATHFGIVARAASNKENLNDGIDLLKEVIFAPRLTQENLDKAKAEIKLAYDGAVKNPVGKALEEMYPDNPKFYSAEHRVENLDNITLDDVTNFYAKIMQNAEARVVVTADGTQKNRALANLQKTPVNFDAYKLDFHPDTTPVTGTKVITQVEDRNQASIIQAFKVDQSQNVKDVATLSMLNKVLGSGSSSRLFMDLRENQKLAYSVHSNYIYDGNDARIQLGIQTTTEDTKNGLNFYDNVEKSLEGFKKHIVDLQNMPIPEEELNQAKLSLLSENIFTTESTAGKHANGKSSAMSVYGKAYNQELNKAIQEVTPEDIQKMAQNVFSKDSVVSIIANQNTIDANKDYLGSLGERKSY